MKHHHSLAVLALGLFTSSAILQHEQLFALSISVSIAFPAISTYLHERQYGSKSRHGREAWRKARILAVLLVLGLALVELLGKGEKRVWQAFVCIVVSNATLFWIDNASDTSTVGDASPSGRVEPLPAQDESIISDSSFNESPTKEPVQSPAKEESEPTADQTRSIPVEAASIPSQTQQNREFAGKGNGHGEDLNETQIQMCRALYKRVIDNNLAKFRENSCEQEMLDFVDVEACRRFLVARGWSINKAYAQMEQTLQWRMKQKPWTLEFKNSPKCVENPYAFTMRLVGMDAGHRPVLLATFLHALDRWDVENSVIHFEMLLEAARRIITKQFRSNISVNADEQQWIFFIDFAGFSIRDAGAKITYYAGKLMVNFPEMLNQAILLDAPTLFSSAWSLLQTVIDDRVKAKVAFVSSKNLRTKLEAKLGKEMIDWLIRECESCRVHHKHSQSKREYWRIQDDGHDSRGVTSYVNSPFYVETPGDAWAKRQQGR